MFLLLSADFFQKLTFSKDSFRNTIRESNSLMQIRTIIRRSWSKLFAKVISRVGLMSVIVTFPIHTLLFYEVSELLCGFFFKLTMDRQTDILFCLFVWFLVYFPFNSYGHDETVS